MLAANYLVTLFTIAFTLAFALNSVFAIGIPEASSNSASSRKIEIIASFIYAASALSVISAVSLTSLFIFFELMALAAAVIIFSAGTIEARDAGMRYLLVHLMAGVILLAGIALYADSTLDLSTAKFLISWPIKTHQDLANILILIAVLINAASFPLSSWVADSYPAASPSGSVFLSIFTTKTSVFLLLNYFAGNHMLIYVGIVMVFYGIIYAILENDIRRILSYSLVNQVGFMVIAAGVGSELAIKGGALHAFCHIFYKSLLFMSAGSVIVMSGKRYSTELGGLYSSMRYTTLLAIIGAASISSLPFTSGFISKSIILAASKEQNLWLWASLIVASAGVFLHAGLEFPWFTFFQRTKKKDVKDPPQLMLIAMIITAFICIFVGCFPQVIYAALPGGVKYSVYTLGHVSEQLALLIAAAAAFFLLLPLLKRSNTITLDTDWFYRQLPIYISKVITTLNFELRQLKLIRYNKAARIYHKIITKYKLPDAEFTTVNSTIALSLLTLLILLLASLR